MKYQKIPVVIDAIQWTGNNRSELDAFCDRLIWKDSEIPDEPPNLSVKTLESNGNEHHATLNDWLIKGVDGEFYFCKPHIFAKTYKPITENSSEGDRP